MTRVLSGITPTGDVHLGNYLGALRFWAEDQHRSDAFFMLADLHALTVPQDPAELRAATTELAATLLAAGLDPDVCTLFVQSQVHEHAELGWLLECTASVGELRRMSQFKDKSAKGGEESSRAGLFTYPALQAADILLYDADRVPVGDDQRQHVELTRDLAQRFNTRYGDTFVVPELTPARVGARIKDLQNPSAKMSKSESSAGTINLLDALLDVEKKIKRAVTDDNTDVVYDAQARPGVANLLNIYSAVSGEPPAQIAERYSQYGPLKSDLAALLVELLTPIQNRYTELSKDPGELGRILAKGAQKASDVAHVTLARAQANMGLLAPG